MKINRIKLLLIKGEKIMKTNVESNIATMAWNKVQAEKVIAGVLRGNALLAKLNGQSIPEEFTGGVFTGNHQKKVMNTTYLGEIIGIGLGLAVENRVLINEKIEHELLTGNLPSSTMVDEFVDGHTKKVENVEKKFLEQTGKIKKEVKSLGDNVKSCLEEMNKCFEAGDKEGVAASLAKLSTLGMLNGKINAKELYSACIAIQKMAKANEGFFPEESEEIIEDMSRVLKGAKVYRRLGFHPTKGYPVSNVMLGKNFIPTTNYVGK
jgi:hypothetical protein